jgi:hypothetical protein
LYNHSTQIISDNELSGPPAYARSPPPNSPPTNSFFDNDPMERETAAIPPDKDLLVPEVGAIAGNCIGNFAAGRIYGGGVESVTDLGDARG